MEERDFDEPQETATRLDVDRFSSPDSLEYLSAQKEIKEISDCYKIEPTLESFKNELEDEQQVYQTRVSRGQDKLAVQSQEKIDQLQHGLELIILTNLGLIQQKIKSITEIMDKKIIYHGFNHYEDIELEISDINKALLKKELSIGKRKQYDQSLNNYKEIQQLNEEIKLLQIRQKKFEDELLEKEYNDLLITLETSLENIASDIQQCKEDIQKYEQRNNTKQKEQSQEQLSKYERLEELALKLNKFSQNEKNSQKDNTFKVKGQSAQDFYQNDEEEKAVVDDEEEEVKGNETRIKNVEQNVEFDVNSSVNQKINEQIKIYYEITKNKVESFEKILYACLYHLSLKMKLVKYENEITDEQLIELLFKLQQRSDVQRIKADKEITEALSFMNVTKNYEDTFKALKKLLFSEQIISFNFLEFTYLMDKANSTKNILKNKDVILLLGITGSGKSTTVQYLCGQEMKALTVNGIKHIEAVSYKNNQLLQVKSSCSSKSETRYVTPITLNLKDIGQKSGNEVILVDTPGSEDLESAEVDLANGLAIIKSVREAASVRIVLLFGYQNFGNRFESLKKQLQFYSKIITNIEKSTKSITYIFTQVPPDNINEIVPKLQNISENLNPQEHSDRDFKFVIQDALSQPEKVIVLDPLDKKPLNVIEKILKTKKIKNVRESFRNTISKPTSHKLQSQFNLHKEQIEIHFKNYEYALALEKLIELKELTNIIEENSIRDLYTKINAYIKEIIIQWQKKIDAFVDRNQHLELAINNEEIEEIIETLKKLKESKDVIKFLDDENLIGGDACEINISRISQRICDFLNKNIDIDDQIWDQSLQKLNQLAKINKKNQDNESMILRVYDSKLAKIIQQFEHQIRSEFEEIDPQRMKKNENQYELQSLVLAQKILRAQEAIPYPKIQEKIMESLGKIEFEIIQNIEKYQKINIDHFFSNNQDESNLLNQNYRQVSLKISEYFLILNFYKSNYHKVSLNLQNYFHQNFQQFKDQIINVFEKILQRFRGELESKKTDLQRLQQDFKNICSIQNIKEVKSETYPQYAALSNNFDYKIQQLITKVEKTIDQLSGSDINETEGLMKKLKSSLIKIMKLSKIMDESNLLDSFKEDFEVKLLELFSKTERKIRPKEFGLFTNEQLEEYFKSYNMLKSIEVCYQIFDDGATKIVGKYERLLDKTLQTIKNYVEHIKKQYSKENKQQWKSIKEIQFDQLYLHYISIRIAIDNKFIFFQSEKGEEVDVQRISLDIIEIVKKQAKLIYQETKKLFQDLPEIQKSAESQLNTDISYHKSCREYDVSIQQIIRNVKLINNIEKNKQEFFDVFINKQDEINQRFWENEIEYYNKEMIGKLEEIISMQNKKRQKIYLSFTESLCKLNEKMSEKEQYQMMKGIYEQLRHTFSKNQSSYQNEIEEEFKKLNPDWRLIKEKLKFINEFELNGEQIFPDIENLLLRYAVGLQEQVQFEEKYTFTEVKNIIAIKKLKEMDQDIFPTKQLSQRFQEKMKEILKETEDKLLINLSQNAQSFEFYLENQEYAQIDLGLEINKQYILGLQYLKSSKEQDLEREQEKYLLRVQEILENALKTAENKINIPKLINEYSNILIDTDFQNLRLKHIFASFQNKIVKIITAILDEIEQKNDQAEIFQVGIRSIENLMERLPKSFYQGLLNKKQSLYSNLDKMNSEELSLIDSLKKSNNIEELIEKFKTSKNQEIKRSLLTYFEQYAQSNLQNAEIKLKKDIITDSMKNLGQVSKFQQILVSSGISHINIQFEKIIDDLAEKVNDKISKIQNCLTSYQLDKYINQDQDILLSYYKGLKEEENLNLIRILKDAQNKIENLNARIIEKLQTLESNLDQINPESSNFQIDKYMNSFQQYQQLHSLLQIFVPLCPQNQNCSKIKQITDQCLSIINGTLKSYQNIQLIKEGQQNEIQRHHQQVEKICNNMQLLSSIPQLEIQDINSEYIQYKKDELFKSISQQFEQLMDTMIAQLPNVIEGHEKVQKNFDNRYLNVQSIIKNIKSIQAITSKINRFAHQIDFDIQKIIESYQEKIVQNSLTDFTIVCKDLILLQKFSLNVMLLQNNVQETLQQAFSRIKTHSNFDFNKFVVNLYNYLKTDQIGLTIIQESPIFENSRRQMFKQKTVSQKIEEVLNDLQSNDNDIDKSFLKEQYDNFHKIYEQKVEENMKREIDLSKIIYEIKTFAASQVTKGGNLTENIPELLALIFALWTLKDATGFLNYSESENKKDYLLQPHSAQVLSIFRLLGIGYKTRYEIFGVKTIFRIRNNSIKNNLVEIKTGEGKSITLGVVSIIFALFGFKVNCACYSKYLSQRDFDSFSSLFVELGVQDSIFYGTFNEICEKTINKNGDLRELVVDKVLTKTLKLSQESYNYEEEKDNLILDQILLIDEVDVFFSQSFYGALYQPKVSLQHESIKELILFIWNNKDNQQILDQIQDQEVYNQCKSAFNPQYTKLLEEAVKSMIFDLNDLQNHNEYVCIDGKLGYNEQDQINCKITIGYLTMWAYCQEYERDNVTLENRDAQLCIGLKFGAFSYAKIAEKFKSILGVSGTLSTLTEVEKQILSNYKIKALTFIPSVYRKNNLRFKEIDDVIVTDIQSYYLEIINNIQMNIRTDDNYNRCVLIIFENEKKLQEFYESQPLKDSGIEKTKLQRLTEKCDTKEKKSTISHSTFSDTITLATKSFGRGTDFITLDEKLNKRGGTHVIQTYFAASLSEEVQIKGRTARQGNPGSYCMILLDSELTQLNLRIDEIDQLKKERNVYAMLNKKRNAVLELTQKIETEGVMIKLKKPHEEAEKFRVELLLNNQNYIFDTLINLNKGRSIKQKIIRTLILMDATGSMGSIILNTKNEITEIIQRINNILAKTNNSITFQIQIAAYRNYNAPPELILEVSPWETNPENLRKFLEQIIANYGLGEEAIEVGFWHAGQQANILDQVLLLGDASPNPKKYVKKELSKHPYNNSKYVGVKYYEQELEKLQTNKIPVHAYYLHKQAELGFKRIAQLTGGTSDFLNVDYAQSSYILRDKIARQLLNCAEKKLEINNLVASYDRSYDS